jgi:hypothetical protein
MVMFEPEETKPLVYLHMALFESVRLYLHLPGSIERKEALAGDVLPGQQWIPRWARWRARWERTAWSTGWSGGLPRTAVCDDAQVPAVQGWAEVVSGQGHIRHVDEERRRGGHVELRF